MMEVKDNKRKTTINMLVRKERSRKLWVHY